MTVAISSDRLEVAIKEIGAELCSIRDADGVEYIWQADPAVWGKHAPILFPIVGRLIDDTYLYEGKSYNLPKHGFARGMNFAVADQTENSVCMSLTASPETKEMYPFEFIFNVRFRLLESCLEVEYEVVNTDKVPVPCSVGGHPAFALSWGANDGPRDYFIEFERAEIACTHRLDSEGYMMDEVELMLSSRQTIRLAEHTFDDDALMFFDHKSRSVRLRSRKHARHVRIDFPGFTELGIWSKPGANYVCIEPWCGYNDMVGGGGDIMKKPGIVIIEPGTAFSRTHSISIVS